MTTKAQYEAVLTQLSLTEDSVIALENTTHDADASDPFETDFTAIHATIEEVRTWAGQKIQEQVMIDFLAEMRVVFEKYSSTISTMAFEDGYGVGYGEPGTGFLLTASLDGVTSTKEIKKAVIGKEDLV